MRQFGGSSNRSYGDDGKWPFWGRFFMLVCLAVILGSIIFYIAIVEKT